MLASASPRVHPASTSWAAAGSYCPGPLLPARVGAGHAATRVDRVGECVHEVDDAPVGAGELRDGVAYPVPWTSIG